MYYKLPEISYYRPGTLDEAVRLLREVEGSKVIAGGTDLLVDMKTSRVKARALIDIGSIAELRGVEDLGEVIRIGAATKLQELLEPPAISQSLPLLKAAIESMGSWQIRNMATIGGNVCNASPAADTAPPLLAYEAEFVAVSWKGLRVIPATKFFIGYRRTALSTDEILKEIIIKKSEWTGWSYIKLGRRAGFTLSIVSVAVLARTLGDIIDDIRISLNSVAPVPIRAYKAEEILRGRRVDRGLMEEAARVVASEVSPIDDVRSTSWYRKEMSYRLALDALTKALGGA